VALEQLICSVDALRINNLLLKHKQLDSIIISYLLVKDAYVFKEAPITQESSLSEVN
jgi:hypothetical protein